MYNVRRPIQTSLIPDLNTIQFRFEREWSGTFCLVPRRKLRERILGCLL